ncbi:MAG: hypothetical protein ACR652_00555 [Methylocystis sp.]|uniref:hypothetical protein n=1 Tax=Methylocystis sp. TaxID=1911079 RepID=UPI003DA518BD
MQDDFKERQRRALEFSAQGVQRSVIAFRCGITPRQVRDLLEKARAAGDERANPRAVRAVAGGVYGVPRDLVGAFRGAAKARGMTPDELRLRILDVVTRDNLFDALELGERPRPKKGGRH